MCKLIVQKTFRIRLGIFWNSYAHSTDVLYPGGIVVNFWIHAGYKSSVFIVWEVLNLVWEVFFMHDLQRRIGRTSRSFVIGYSKANSRCMLVKDMIAIKPISAANISCFSRRSEDAFRVTIFHLPRLLQDLFKVSLRSVCKTYFHDVCFKTSCKHVLKTSWKTTKC